MLFLRWSISVKLRLEMVFIGTIFDTSWYLPLAAAQCASAQVPQRRAGDDYHENRELNRAGQGRVLSARSQPLLQQCAAVLSRLATDRNAARAGERYRRHLGCVSAADPRAYLDQNP